MTDEEITQRINKLAEIDPELVPVFLKDPDNFDYSQLEGYTAFTDKYKNVADFTGDKAKILSDLYQQMDGQYPSDARLLSIQQQYPFINAAELKDWFDKTNAYKAEYEAEREAIANRKKREQEVKDWGWRDFIASDYEKQRYVDDPNAALFGEQAPDVGKAPETRWGAAGDLATGIAAGAADVAPLPFGAQIWAGPAIRAARDIGHKVSDSPYKKDLSDIGTDAIKDMSFNLGAAFLANAKRGARIASLASDPKVGEALAIADETRNIQKGIQDVAPYATYPKDAADVAKGMKSDAELYTAVHNMPESELKNELIPLVSNFTNRPINRAAINEQFAKYSLEANPTAIKMNKALLRQNQLPMAFEGNSNFYNRALTTPTFEDLSAKNKFMYGVNRAVEKVNVGYPGQAIIQGMNTATGRGNQPNIVETALRQKEKEDTINRLISSYSLLWNKKNPPPEAKDSPIIKAAWEKWSKE